jgi:16S rRNA U516 pseudouridylate synthase RsuA-like enzyme
VRVGPLTLGNLAPGASRLLTDEEVAALRQAVGWPDSM